MPRPTPLPAIRAIVAAAAVLLVLITASGARLVQHELHAVKCGACRVRAAQLTDGRRDAGLASRRGGMGGRPTAVAAGRIIPAPFRTYPTSNLWRVRYARPSGADALGVSVPRGRHWAVLGGHGRLGVG